MMDTSPKIEYLHVLTIEDSLSTSRKVYRNSIVKISNWCDENLQDLWKVWYRNNPTRVSEWRFVNENDALLFKLMFGGHYRIVTPQVIIKSELV